MQQEKLKLMQQFERKEKQADTAKKMYAATPCDGPLSRSLSLVTACHIERLYLFRAARLKHALRLTAGSPVYTLWCQRRLSLTVRTRRASTWPVSKCSRHRRTISSR